MRKLNYLKVLNVILDCIFFVYDNHWSSDCVQISVVQLVWFAFDCVRSDEFNVTLKDVAFVNKKSTNIQIK